MRQVQDCREVHQVGSRRAPAGLLLGSFPGRLTRTGLPIIQTMSWANLGRRAKAFRIVHTAWSVVSLTCLGYIWACAVTGRRDRRLWASVAFLSIEGAGLVVGRGNCPMGPLQAQWGDPKPFFELVLPPRAAKAAVPVLAGITVAGIALVVVRWPSRR